MKHPTFCTGQDVRPVIRRRSIGNGRFAFDGARVNWCKGCRELMAGAFKYPKP